MLRKMILTILALMLFLLPAQAEEAVLQNIAVQEVAAQLGENSVCYPQLNGMADEALQQKINDDIVLSSGVSSHMITLLTLASQQTLTVDYDAWLSDELFSVVISAKGKLPQKRDGHSYTALTYDLKTGERVTLDALFADVDAAVARMEELAVETLSEELNGYLEYSDITPLPVDSFTLDEDGITFWYPAEQFSLASGYSGACQFWYAELADYWLEQPAEETDAGERRALIETLVEEGRIPHVPVMLGDDMQTIADEYRLLRTPDEFPGGRYFIMEAPAFRSILLISDSIQWDYSESVLEGIQLRRGELCGLVIGRTDRESWQQLLGEPDSVISMSENMAYDYGLYEGVCDVYRFGENELRLYADAENTLRTIQLCK